MLERHSTLEIERDLEGDAEKPGRMTMIERERRAEREQTEPEPYWDFEHVPRPKEEASRNKDPLSEENVAIWVALVFLIALSIATAYFVWAMISGL